MSAQIVGWAIWRNGKYIGVYDDYDEAKKAQDWNDTIEPKTASQIEELEKFGVEFVKTILSPALIEEEQGDQGISNSRDVLNPGPLLDDDKRLSKIDYTLYDETLKVYRPSTIMEVIDEIANPKKHINASEFVYVVAAQENMITPRYKIGATIKLDKRISALQGASPIRLELVHCINTQVARLVESILHNVFDFVRSHNEWFELNQSDLDWLQSIHYLDGGKLIKKLREQKQRSPRSP